MTTPTNPPEPPPAATPTTAHSPQPPATPGSRPEHLNQPPATSTPRHPRALRRLAPAAALFFLAPLVGEYLLGNISIVGIAGLVVLAPMYGGGAVLIREVARRTGRGFPTMLVLGLAYGLLQAGAVDQTLFEPPVLEGAGQDPSATFVPALGFSVFNLLTYVVGHAVWSISVPVALVETFVPSRRATPWLGRPGLAVAAALYAAGSLVILSDASSPASAPQFIGVSAATLALVGLAFTLGRRPRPAIDRPAPRRLWLVGLAAFVVSFLFGWNESWAGVAFSVVVAAATAGLVSRWSRRRGWGAAHRLALAGGALLQHAVIGFLLTQLYGREGAIHVAGNAVFALGAVALLVAAARRVRRPGPRA